MNPPVSVIIPSWGRKDEVLKTLEDLRSQSFKDFEILVIEQGNLDGAVEAIRGRYPEARLICLDRGVGAPKARNIGSESARGDILVFLDNDASLDELALQHVVERMAEEPSVGLIGFKILDSRTHELDLASWAYQKNKLQDRDKEFETYIFCGCGYAMRKDVFEKGGGYWNGIFWLSEEFDLSLNVLRLGYKIFYDPSIQAYHRSSPEKRDDLARRNFYGFRNMIWCTWRYYPFWSAIAATFVKTGAYLVKGLRNGYFIAILASAVSAFGKVYLLLDNRCRFDTKAWKRYQALSYKGSPWRTLRGLFGKVKSS